MLNLIGLRRDNYQLLCRANEIFLASESFFTEKIRPASAQEVTERGIDNRREWVRSEVQNVINLFTVKRTAAW